MYMSCIRFKYIVQLYPHEKKIADTGSLEPMSIKLTYFKSIYNNYLKRFSRPSADSEVDQPSKLR